MIEVSKSRFEIELLDAHCPQGFWGSRLRGIYGHFLKQTRCLQSPTNLCQVCQFPASCPYTALFELTPLSPKGRPFPPPYLFIPPPVVGSAQERYGSGTTLSFDLITIGPHCRDITSAVEAFRYGIIESQARFALRSVGDVLDPTRQLDLSAKHHTVSSRNLLELITPTLWTPDQQLLTVTFLTNTRVENRHSRIKDARTGLTIFSDFYDLVYNIMLRFGGLWEVYGVGWPGRNEFKAGLDFHLQAARRVELMELSLEVNQLLRRSSRKRAPLPIDGFTGQMVFAGNTTLFAHLLRIGELFGVGNHTNIGLGRYSLDVK
jgi:hypothetical protein